MRISLRRRTGDEPAPTPSTGPAVTDLSAELSTAPVAQAMDTQWDSFLSTETGRHITRRVAMTIPSVRKAMHAFSTISTFGLHAEDAEGMRLPADVSRAWLEQPEARRRRSWTINRTIQDLVWHDLCVWRITDTSLMGTPRSFERMHPARVDAVAHPLDPDTITEWRIDSVPTDPARLVIFDGGGIGGIEQFGAGILTIYTALQAAAGRYAKTPNPLTILANVGGADLAREDVKTLLAEWEKAVTSSSVAYRNKALDVETPKITSPRELQLTEAREHAALETARLFGLPAFALDANQPGASMTYGNITDRRRDLVESLRPWMSVIEDTLSLDDRSGRTAGTVLPRGIRARFDVTAYTRDDPKTRMETWKNAKDAGALTNEEIRAAEPLARKDS